MSAHKLPFNQTLFAADSPFELYMKVQEVIILRAVMPDDIHINALIGLISSQAIYSEIKLHLSSSGAQDLPPGLLRARAPAVVHYDHGRQKIKAI